MASNQKGFMPGAQGQYQGGQLPLGVTPGQLAGGYQPQGSRSNFTTPSAPAGGPPPASRPFEGSSTLPDRSIGNFGGTGGQPGTPGGMGRPMPGSPQKSALYGSGTGGVVPGGGITTGPPGAPPPSPAPLGGAGIAGAGISAPPLQGTQIPSSGPAPMAAGPLPMAAQAEPGPIPAPVPPTGALPPPAGGMTGGPLTPNPKPPGGFTGVNPYTQKPAQYGRIMPGQGGAGPLRPPGSV